MTTQEVNDFLTVQKKLQASLAVSYDKIEASYQAMQSVFNKFQDQLIQQISKRLALLSEKQRLALVLVDIQNDFVLSGGSLYAPGGEGVVLSNMALLDAVSELAKTNDLQDKIELITTQDTHRFERQNNHLEQMVLHQAYGEEMVKNILAIESRELLSIDPSQAQFGLHCIVGTPGVLIATPIEQRLKRLENLGVTVCRFGKLNFSCPQAGLKLKENLDLRNLSTHPQGIFCETSQGFLGYCKEHLFAELIFTGICGDICVKECAIDLSNAFRSHDKYSPTLHVLDPCVHYLVIPQVTSNYQAVRHQVEALYADSGVKVLTLKDFCSNQLYDFEG